MKFREKTKCNRVVYGNSWKRDRGKDACCWLVLKNAKNVIGISECGIDACDFSKVSQTDTSCEIRYVWVGVHIHVFPSFNLAAVGTISWNNFKVLFERKLKEDEEEKELKEAFRVLDNHKKGVIPVDDLRWILKSLGLWNSHLHGLYTCIKNKSLNLNTCIGFKDRIITC